MEQSTITVHTDNDSCYHPSHNRRDPLTIRREIEKGTSTVQIGGWYENWIDISVKQAYEDIFGEWVKKYNERQKRKDRRIDSYYQEIKKDKQKSTVYETIVGVYRGEARNNPQKCHDILYDYVQAFIKANPRIKVIGAYFHADEDGESPHVHLDWIPIADGYVKGLEVQTSQSKCFEQEGYSKMNADGDTAYEQFHDVERHRLIDICADYGIEAVILNEEERKHQKTKEYKEKQRNKELEKQNEALKAENASIRADNDIVNAELKKAQKELTQTRTENARLQRDNDNLRKDKEKLESKVYSLEMQVKEQESRLTNLDEFEQQQGERRLGMLAMADRYSDRSDRGLNEEYQEI